MSLSFFTERTYRRVFVFGILIKAFDGFIEATLGTALLFTPTLIPLVLSLATGELIEDPTDVLANTLQHYVPFLVPNGLFISFYLLSHGLVKLFLASALLKDRLWAYPVALAVFGAFVVYQMYKYSLNSSVWLIVLSIFDAAIILLTYHEWQYLKRHAATP